MDSLRAEELKEQVERVSKIKNDAAPQRDAKHSSHIEEWQMAGAKFTGCSNGVQFVKKVVIRIDNHWLALSYREILLTNPGILPGNTHQLLLGKDAVVIIAGESLEKDDDEQTNGQARGSEMIADSGLFKPGGYGEPVWSFHAR